MHLITVEYVRDIGYVEALQASSCIMRIALMWTLELLLFLRVWSYCWQQNRTASVDCHTGGECY